jgi:cytochrome bd ubiquinol oxidase subunit II
MLEIVIAFLGLSLVLYVLFGGADFGGGIIELLFRKRLGETQKNIIARAIAPVWEANHMWLIIVVVILFVGFPLAYSVMLTYLHIPVLALLIGIIIRGTAFTFKHYDAIKDKSQTYYDILFRISSLWTSFFLGLTTGAMVLGHINETPSSFTNGFITPWFNLFCLSVGIFTCCVFAFLAAIYLIGESDDKDSKQIFKKIALQLNIATVVSGAFVFTAAEIDGYHMAAKFLNSTFSILSIILASISLPVLWFSLTREKWLISRLAAGFQVLMIMFAWYSINFPVFLNINNSRFITLTENPAAPATINMLGWALIIGSAFILPFLYYLMRVFKYRQVK